ncbi:MAG: hypothetical protein ACE5GW_14120 [Planctomycetota bacterium]
MKLTDANRPLRVLDKVLQGGLGAGNVGVLMSRHGTGKIAVLTSIALDHAMDGRNTLHVSVGKSVSDIRAFHNEVLNEIVESLGLGDRGELFTKVERHKQIYTYRDGSFSLERLRESLGFLAEHAEFQPEIVELQGWPDFESTSREEFQELKAIAAERSLELWCAAQSHRDDPTDERGVPDHVRRLEEEIEVLVALEPEGEHVRLRFIKTHGTPPPEGIHLEFDPKSMLIRWR